VGGTNTLRARADRREKMHFSTPKGKLIPMREKTASKYLSKIKGGNIIERQKEGVRLYSKRGDRCAVLPGKDKRES